jgi:hypothetical protein
MNIVVVHGFNVTDGGEHTVDKLGPFAIDEGYSFDYDEADYGFFNLWMVRLTKKKLRRRVIYRIARAIEKADIIITHSNGANFATQALEMLSSEYNNSKIVIHISPALDKDTPIPLAAKAQLVMHTPHDFWVRLSSWIPIHPWGRMGARGYSGEDNRNTNMEDPEIKGHSAWFHVEHVATTWRHCDAFIKEHNV